MKFINIVLTLGITLTVAACGGGGASNELPSSFGAIAINQNTGAAGISAKYTTQAGADSRALAECGSSCVVVLQYNYILCAALARSNVSPPVFGWASGSSDFASSEAVKQCTSKNGTGCTVVLSQCN